MIRRITVSLLLILIAYKNVFQMYFWHDDYTHLYKAQQGISSIFPYRFFSFSVPILYKIFGLNPFYYFVLGVVLYFITSLFLYYLFILIFENEYYAFLGTAIFASGYVGQGSITMFLGDGVATLFILPFVVLLFILYISFLKRYIYKYYYFSIFLSVFILIAAPHRYVGLFVPLVLLDWIYKFLKKRQILHVLARNVVFAFIFYFVYRGKAIGFQDTWSIYNFLIQLGNLWNFIFPSYVQEHFLLISSFISALPVYFIFLFIMLSEWKSKRKVILWMGGFVVLVIMNFVLLRIIPGFIQDKFIRAESMNGILLIVIFIYLLILDVNRKAIFIFCAFLGSLSVFFIADPSANLDSSHRYLMAYVFIPPLIILLFAKSKKSLVSIFTIVLILLRLISATTTQTQFYEDYSSHFKIIYAHLKRELPVIDGQTLIYMEGTTKENEFVVADASRVGELPTQAAFAVHYKVPMKYILWAETGDDIKDMVKKYNLSINNVFSFIYDGSLLKNTSYISRDMLISPEKYAYSILVNKFTKIPAVLYSYIDGSSKIYSVLPLTVDMGIDNPSNKEINFRIEWEYDTYGPLERKKYQDFTINPKSLKKFIFNIGSGGSYIKKISVLSSEGGSMGLRIGSIIITP